jgi:hypothetical protein
VPVDNFYAILPRKSSIPIHDEGDVFGDGALTESSQKKLLELLEGPFDRRKLK